MANMTVKIVRNGLPLTPIRPYTVRIARHWKSPRKAHSNINHIRMGIRTNPYKIQVLFPLAPK